MGIREPEFAAICAIGLANDSKWFFLFFACITNFSSFARSVKSGTKKSKKKLLKINLCLA